MRKTTLFAALLSLFLFFGALVPQAQAQRWQRSYYYAPSYYAPSYYAPSYYAPSYYVPQYYVPRYYRPIRGGYVYTPWVSVGW